MMPVCTLAVISRAEKLLMEAALMQSSMVMYFADPSQDVLPGRAAHLVSGMPRLRGAACKERLASA